MFKQVLATYAVVGLVAAQNTTITSGPPATTSPPVQCNLAHSYAYPLTCEAIDGGYVLVTLTSSPMPTSSSSIPNECNLGHPYSYPVSCEVISGGYLLTTLTSSPAPATTTTVTSIVGTLTTYCSEATTITTNGATYTATAGETLTITDCPCTISGPASMMPSSTMSSVPESYTGAASRLVAEGALALAALVAAAAV